MISSLKFNCMTSNLILANNYLYMIRKYQSFKVKYHLLYNPKLSQLEKSILQIKPYSFLFPPA
jgi:hypothetical protein